MSGSTGRIRSRGGRFSLAALCMALFCADCGPSSPVNAASSSAGSPARIVSLAPSITEVLFALGLGDRVVGITSDCVYPPEALRKPKVGDFLKTGAEAVVALEPDLVLFPSTQEDLRTQLSGLGIRCVRVDQYSVQDILQSVQDLGRLGGVPDRAEALVTEMKARLERVQTATRDLPRPRVLVVVGRDYAAATLDQVYIASAQSFYGGLVDLAGGINVYDQAGFPYPMVSGEGLMQLRPDVIVEVVHDRAARGIKTETLRAAWHTLPDLPAVKNGRIHTLEGDHVGIPGPRVPRIVEDLARLLHPEVRL